MTALRLPGPTSPPRHAWSQGTTVSSGASSTRPLPGSRTVITHHANPVENAPSAAKGAAAAAASTTMEAMLGSGGGGSGSATMIIPPSEADRLIDCLRPFSVSRIGSDAFMRMYGRDLERLSLQAHLSAASVASGSGSAHEYVVESVLTYGKVPVLVRTLLAVELWRTRVLTLPASPKDAANEGETNETKGCGLAQLLAKNGNALRTAFALHAETTIAGLLNLVLYKSEAFDDMDGETAVALVDYCARCLASLAAPPPQNAMVRRQKQPESAAELADRIRTRSTFDEIVDARLDAEYKTCVGATSLARYLCEHIASLPLGAQTRILDTHDFLVMAVPIIDEPPWTRRRTAGDGGHGAESTVNAWEKYIDGSWVGVSPADLLQITKCEAQPWIMIFHLLCADVCRERYGLNTFRKEQLLRLRKFLNNVVLDQLPVLADVMRYMDELALMDVPESSTGQGSALLMQQVDSMREDLTRGLVWETVVREQFDTIFSKVTDATDEELRIIADVYGEGGFETVLGEETIPFELSSLPIEEITLCLSDKKDVAAAPIAALKLTPAEDSPETIVQTPHGPFRRLKMSVRRLDGDDAPLAVSPHSMVVAKARFEGFSHHATTLRCDDIGLPSSTSDVASKSKEWRQLGRLEERLVLQMGFKLLSRQSQGENDIGSFYAIEQAFISQPMLEHGES